AGEPWSHHVMLSSGVCCHQRLKDWNRDDEIPKCTGADGKDLHGIRESGIWNPESGIWILDSGRGIQDSRFTIHDSASRSRLV
ncbi:MAG: hypothetical protein QF886_24290, partial [Planctomycetota bacterium]|nr:hypothetical protein [Planctomycetota bacterium]